MQTFVPLYNYTDCAAVLDRQRLGKQRVECLQILNVLIYKRKGWQNHPATKMWRGYELALVDYAMAVCDEWTSRGYKDTCKDKIIKLTVPFTVKREHITPAPFWWGDEHVHSSHRAVLIKKNPVYYLNAFRNRGIDVMFDGSAEYYWPV